MVISWLSGYPRLLEGYQANVTWLSSLVKVIYSCKEYVCLYMVIRLS